MSTWMRLVFHTGLLISSGDCFAVVRSGRRSGSTSGRGLRHRHAVSSDDYAEQARQLRKEIQAMEADSVGRDSQPEVDQGPGPEEPVPEPQRERSSSNPLVGTRWELSISMGREKGKWWSRRRCWCWRWRWC